MDAIAPEHDRNDAYARDYSDDRFKDMSTDAIERYFREADFQEFMRGLA